MRTNPTISIAAAVSVLLIATAKLTPAQEIVPPGWGKAGTDPTGYKMTIDKVTKRSGNASAHISRLRKTGSADDFGTLMQTIKADEFRGKRLRMTAWMKTANADSAQLWMRLDGTNRMLGFDNMDSRPVRGTTDWKKYDVVLDVPEATVNIAFGAFVAGNGEAWVDDFTFEVVDTKVPSTNMMTEAMVNEVSKIPNHQYPLKPKNLDFEQPK